MRARARPNVAKTAIASRNEMRHMRRSNRDEDSAPAREGCKGSMALVITDGRDFVCAIEIIELGWCHATAAASSESSLQLN